jgi:hypothetical protein
MSIAAGHLARTEAAVSGGGSAAVRRLIGAEAL